MRRTLGLATLSALLGCSAGLETPDDPTAAEDIGQTSSAYVNASFTVKSFANRCIDVGGDAYQAVGSPVYIYACNGSTAQSLRAVELTDGSFDFRLITNKGFCLGVTGGSVAAGRALVLQACVNAPATIPSTQRFAFDGDTLFVGTQTTGRVARDLVVEVSRGRGANRTPLVVGARDLDPAEDFRFVPVNPFVPYPHSGFRRVASAAELDAALASPMPGAVIEVASNTSIRIDDDAWRFLKAGVTLRGGRRGMNDGPEIYRAKSVGGVLLKVDGSDVRVTGLRLRGFSTSKDDDLATVTGIRSDTPAYRALIDHNEMSAWTNAAVEVKSSWETKGCYIGSPPPQNTRVVANYIHDNSRENAGYGVVSGSGGNPYIDGNTFTRNRHAVTADYRGQTSYTAVFNLVTESNRYCNVGVFCWKEQDFDVHGSEDGSHYQGGVAGHLFFMSSNTFMPNGKNIDIRGTPCNLARINSNVFLNNNQSDAIENASTEAYKVQIFDNVYPPAISSTVQGDFDGDGVLDDFIGTGAAWYYRPGRTKDWRLLNRYNERHHQLTFGDFDGDGRTDVRVVDAQGKTVTSWGGSSPWDDGSNWSVIVMPVFGGQLTEVAPR